MIWTQLFSRRNVLGFLAVLAVLPLGCTKDEAPAEEEEEHAAPVKWEAAEKADLEEWTELLGVTQPLPSRVAYISAPLGGYVLSVLPSDHGKAIVEGQRVEKGQILVQLDDRVLRANREKLLVSDPELQEQIKQAGHAQDLAHLEVERLERLLQSSGTSVLLVTQVEMDKARLALKDAESKYKGVKAREEIARAELKVIDEQMNQYTLRAPLAGQLGMVHAYPGQTLTAGTSVAEVINLDEIDVLCFVPANTVNRLHLDQVVRIEEKEEAITDAVKLEQGRIVFISDQALAETGTIAVKARFPNQHRKLRANTLLRVRVLTEKKSECITLPEAALLEDQEEPAVLIVETEKKKDKEGRVIKDKDGKDEEEHHVKKLVAKLGLRDREKHRVEILGLFEVEEEKKKPVPLEHDTLFVVEGGHGLENDDLVTEKKEEKKKKKKKKKKKEKKKEEWVGARGCGEGLQRLRRFYEASLNNRGRFAVFNLASHARHYFGAVLLSAMLLTLGGIYAATRMPSAVYPEVTFPRISVIARKPGLDVPNMQVKVTIPLEEAISTVIGVAKVRSKTIRGASELSLDFNPGVNMLQAEQFTWNRLGTARSKLPPDVDLEVERMTPSVFPILSLVLTGGDSPAQLRDFAYFNLAPNIKNIPDVLYANVAGGDLREIEVEPRPESLLAAGLSAADLADQIAKVHRLQPVGRIEQPPFAYQVIVNTQSETARDIGNLVITAKNDQPLLVSELADVRIGRMDRVLSIGYEEKDAVVITVFRSPGGNTINISQAVQDLLVQMEREHHIPHNVHAKVVYDQATFIRTAVQNVRDAILIGGLFSILILLAFLRSWRATLISALAIPTTLAITFLFLHWAGETLNLMSLGGLAVAIGLIIDDTVVVIENIARHLEKKPSDNAVSSLVIDPVGAASKEITGAVVGSTLTTVLVFLPLAFIVGVYGQFFASLSWALSIAVLVSMVISLSLIPVFAVKFLAGRPMPPPGPLYRAMAWLYELVLGLALRVPWLTLTGSVAAVGIGVILYTGLPDWREPEEGKKERPPLVSPLKTGLMPAMDEGAFVVDYFAPSGTPLAETEEKARVIEEVLSENPDVEAYVRRTGAELGLFATATNQGDIQVVLRAAEDDPVSLFRKPVRPEFSKVEEEMMEAGKQEAARKFGPHFTEKQAFAEGKAYIRGKYRRRSGEEVGKEIQGELEEKFTEHQLKVEVIPIITDELNDLSGANKPVEVKLFGPDYHHLDELAEKVGKALKKLKDTNKSIHDIDEAVYAGNPDLEVKIDGVRAARFGLSPDAVERQLNAMFFGQVATQVRESALRVTNVRVRYPDSYRFGKDRFDPQRVLNQWLLLPEGAPALPGVSPSLGHNVGLARVIPLYSLAEIKRKRTTDEQWRENQRPVHFVTAELDEETGGDLGAVVRDIREQMKHIPLESGYSWEMGGHYVQQMAAFKSFAVVMVIAVLLVYIMLVFQFRSVMLPLLIFLTQPLSLVSGLFALWITGTPLNVSSYMGAILLIGLDMKNGILLVEYIQQLRREGMELRPALLLAGRTRFRPILMTSMAAILGLAPLALGIGPGAQMQQPLAIMVIGGITANMLFTRMIIPVGYLVLERRHEKKPLVV